MRGIGISGAIRKGVNMFRKLVHTDHDWLLTVVRLVLGIVFFAHGAQKLLGWRAQTLFEDGLRSTIDWYRANAR